MVPNGVAVQSKALLKYYHADMIGLSVACQRRLIVSSVCTKILSHINLGGCNILQLELQKKIFECMDSSFRYISSMPV